MTRDISQTQYEQRLRDHGFIKEPLMHSFAGYWKHEKTGLNVSELNAGPRRRDRLAYLLREVSRFETAQGQ